MYDVTSIAYVTNFPDILTWENLQTKMASENIPCFIYFGTLKNLCKMSPAESENLNVSI